MAIVKLEMTARQYKKLADYLEAHEPDIANDINDYGDLRDLFFLVFETHATKGKIHKKFTTYNP